jgi:hypothetical protein
MLSVLAVCVSKEPHPPRKTVDGRGINISGVDFWHAVEFSRNGRFLRPDQNSLAGSSGLPFGVSNLTRFCFQLVSEWISEIPVTGRFPSEIARVPVAVEP